MHFKKGMNVTWLAVCCINLTKTGPAVYLLGKRKHKKYLFCVLYFSSVELRERERGIDLLFQFMHSSLVPWPGIKPATLEYW